MAAAQQQERRQQLEMTDAALRTLIQERQEKVKELKRSMKLSQEAADRVKAGLRVFSALNESVERRQDQLMATITKKQRKTEEQAEGFIRELEEEISELEMRSSVMRHLQLSEDQLRLLLSLSLSLNAARPTRVWTRVSVPPRSYEGTVVRALAQLEKELSHQMLKLRLRLVAEVEVEEQQQEEVPEQDLQGARRYAVKVTLDPVTAHPKLILSGDGKTVRCGDKWQVCVGYLERFNHSLNVLARQGFSKRFYFEVQVINKTDWTVGVAKESVKRKGAVSVCPSRGCWAIRLRNGNHFHACARSPNSRDLTLNPLPEKVGVYVDYHQGLVSFYNAGTADLIYSFTGCDFSEKLYPFFSPGPYKGGNSAPLVITPVTD